MQRVFEALSGLTPTTYVTDDITEKKLTELGFDDPSYILEFTFKDETVTFLFGNEYQKGFYYMINTEHNFIWGINILSRMPFLNMTFEDFADRMMYGRNIDTINTMTVKAEESNEEWVFELSGIRDDLDVFYNKQKIETGNFKNLYKEFLSLQVEGIWPDYAELDINELKLELTVTIENHKGDLEAIAFYRLDGRRILYTIDGHGVFYILTNQMEKFIDNTRRAANREAIIPTW
jgi:hypothetical protein